MQGHWWFARNEGEEEYNEIVTMFSNFNHIYIYGCPLLEDETRSADNPKWSKVNEFTKDSIEDSKIVQEFVDLGGTDVSNIPENLQKLVKPCMCYYEKPLKFDNLEPRAEYYEIVKVIKNVDLECQVRFKYTEWNDVYEQDVDVKDIELVSEMGRHELKKNQ